MYRTTFSKTGAFRKGQFVSVEGIPAAAVGWKAGPLGKLVAVRITGSKGRWTKGTIVFVRAADVAVRKGKLGAGPLPQFV